MLLLIGIGIALLLMGGTRNDGGYLLGRTYEVRDPAPAFRTILNKYVFIPTVGQIGRVVGAKKRAEDYILLNNGEVLTDSYPHYLDKEVITIELFTGSRNTFNEATMYIYPDIKGRVGIQIKCHNCREVSRVWAGIYQSYGYLPENWLVEYEQGWDLSNKFKKYKAFQYANK